jgi:hypothetical protein
MQELGHFNLIVLQLSEVKAASSFAADVKGESKGEHRHEHTQAEADEHTISADQVLARFDSNKNGTI